MTLLLLILLPTLIHAKITVHIKASKLSEHATAFVTGSISEVISDHDRTAFGITDSALKDQVAKYSGGRPYHVFVKSPTPWNDLYKVFNWNQIKINLYPDSARVLNVSSEVVTLRTQEFVNNSTNAIKFDGNLSEIVQDFILFDWITEKQLLLGEDLDYEVDLYEENYRNLIEKKIMYYSSRWGEAVLKMKDNSVNYEGLLIELAPSQSVLATLSAKLTTVFVEVDYVAELSGEVACNYPNKFDGHHFWAYDVNALLEANNLPKTILTKEIIKLVFTAYPKATFVDMSN